MVCCRWCAQLVVLVRPVPLLSFTISAGSLRKLLPGEFWWSGRFPGALGPSGSLPFTLASGMLSCWPRPVVAVWAMERSSHHLLHVEVFGGGGGMVFPEERVVVRGQRHGGKCAQIPGCRLDVMREGVGVGAVTVPEPGAKDSGTARHWHARVLDKSDGRVVVEAKTMLATNIDRTVSQNFMKREQGSRQEREPPPPVATCTESHRLHIFRPR
ncbi:hypothetical protein DFH08DRAFT_801936 [Mycena albidolilacea]|uniref:Secreted protein n=1 Tax=Mycena albidolilacea TaxID=1033008 RepID=A0AAD7AGG2_9AGAR|nr:hypothetical protein DFH08DRAFT_801936 [Mycena albidolilacea]